MKAHRPDFTSAYLKLDRAKAHIADFDATASDYMARDPHHTFLDFDPVTKRPGYTVSDRTRFPTSLALVVGDAVHNMKSALDHLITACCEWSGGDPTRAYFPIVRERSTLEANIRQKVAGPGAGGIAAALVRQTKPYKRGNPALFAVHCLDIADKHQLTIAVKKTLDVSVTLEGEGVATFRQTFRSASGKRRFIPVPIGMEDRLLPAEVSITSDIVFGRKLPRAGQPCLADLQAFAVETKRVIDLFQTTF